MHHRFWRLLGACELLSREETAALAHRDLAAHARVQEIKSSILADLASQAGLLQASCDSRAQARLAQLLETNRRNARTVADMMESARQQKNEIRGAVVQLRKLRATYPDRSAVAHTPFSAHV